ncbi:hypothetical protein E1301_Tti023712 [Triplophysa tibetana]|uniref:Uncharacterized protein n=1 Tax=Triplophysa tibetana TaxID=1572043 RepID=A0A5A9PHT2_9TELE|nr:hypothetical protein E1301_Tti023712 [Triplophysa tibetana]
MVLLGSASPARKVLERRDLVRWNGLAETFPTTALFCPGSLDHFHRSVSPAWKVLERRESLRWEGRDQGSPGQPPRPAETRAAGAIDDRKYRTRRFGLGKKSAFSGTFLRKVIKFVRKTALFCPGSLDHFHRSVSPAWKVLERRESLRWEGRDQGSPGQPPRPAETRAAGAIDDRKYRTRRFGLGKKSAFSGTFLRKVIKFVRKTALFCPGSLDHFHRSVSPAWKVLERRESLRWEGRDQGSPGQPPRPAETRAAGAIDDRKYRTRRFGLRVFEKMRFFRVNFSNFTGLYLRFSMAHRDEA